MAAEESPEEIRALADRLGLTLDLYQPFRDAEGAFAGNLRRAEAKFALMNRLGIDTSGLQQRRHRVVDSDDVATASTPTTSPPVSCPAWATWPARTESGSPSRRWLGGPTSTTTGGPGGSWSRPITPRSGSAWTASTSCPAGTTSPPSPTSRPRRSSSCSSRTRPRCRWTCCRSCPGAVTTGCSPARGPGTSATSSVAWPPPATPSALAGGLQRHLPADRRPRTAAHAHRSLVWVADQAARCAEGGGRTSPAGLPRVTEVAAPTGIDFVEITAADTSAYEQLFGQLGFAFGGRHRTNQ